MKEIYYLDTTLADPFLPVGLGFDADTFIVTNPTRFTVAMRVGSQSRPRGVADATYSIPPGFLLCLPTNGRQFAFLATTPTLPASLEGMPTRVEVTITAGEVPPAFGALSITGQPAPEAVIIANQADRAAGTYSDTLSLPSDIHSLTFRVLGAQIHTVSIIGVQSGITYFQTPPGFNVSAYSHGVYFRPGQPTFTVDPELDTQIQIGYVAVSSGSNGYRLEGYTERMSPRFVQTDGRLLVDVIPPDTGLVPVTEPSAASRALSLAGQTLINVTGITGAGLKVYGPFTPGYTAGFLQFFLTAGASITMAIISPGAAITLFTAPPTAAAPTTTGLYVFPVAPAGHFSGMLPSGFFIFITHSTAAAASYALTFSPAQ